MTNDDGGSLLIWLRDASADVLALVDFGKYAFDIWLAYGLSAALILGLIGQSVAASRSAKRKLAEAEK